MERDDDMNREFTLIKDYYDDGIDIYKKKTILIKPGVTVLAGCNGIGKSTLLRQIKNILKKNNIPCIKYDNLTEGGEEARSKAGFFGDFQFLATASQSSEGENIIMNMSNLARDIGDFVRSGKNSEEEKFDRIPRVLNGEMQKEEHGIPNERWILLDAVDSGLSVDNIVDIKEQLFKTILKYNYGNEIYIIISANEYEMARDEQCFDVYNGKYVKFTDYEEYRDFILKSREWKNQREQYRDDDSDDRDDDKPWKRSRLQKIKE